MIQKYVTKKISIYLSIYIVSFSLLAERIVVDSTGDQPALDPTVSAQTGQRTVTLRSALERANARLGLDEIHFNIPTSDPGYHSNGDYWTIKPQSNLPTIIDPVIIDGYTQSGAQENTELIGNNAVLKIELTGGGTKNRTVNTGFLLDVGSSGSTIKGLVINNFLGDNIAAPGQALQIFSDDNTISGNFIGLDITGEKDRLNTRGIRIADGINNTIGGNTAQARNVISGSTGLNLTRGEIVLVATAGTKIQGNYLGTNKTGSKALYHSMVGIPLFASFDTLIGGQTIAERNVISGHSGPGIFVAVLNSNTTITGNFFGTTSDGTSIISAPGRPDDNTFIRGNSDGILMLGEIFSSIDNTKIGGTKSEEANVFAGSVRNGIAIGGEAAPLQGRTFIQGNNIGTDFTGSHALGNDFHGIRVVLQPANSPITITNNLISGNHVSGITVAEFTEDSTVIRGNRIGIDKNETHTIGNGLYGIQVGIQQGPVSGITVGGSKENQGNTIANSGSHGVVIHSSSDTTLQGNFIGTNASSVVNLGNNGAGIAIICSSSNNNIEKNIVTHNAKGVIVGLSANDAGINNAITRNAIFNNDTVNTQLSFNGMGIDLANDGPTSNHGENPIEDAPNNFQNYPVITFRELVGPNLRVMGILHSVPNSIFRIEFYNNVIDRSPITEGQTLIGSRIIRTNASGDASFDVLLNNVSANTFISTTATRLLGQTRRKGDTSEFSPNIPTSCCNIILTKDAPTSAAAGELITYTITITNQDPLPLEDIVVTDVLPSQVTFVSAEAAGWALSTAGQTVTFTRSSLAARESSTLTIVGRLALFQGEIVNTVSARSARFDPNRAIPTVTARTFVAQRSALSQAIFEKYCA